MSQQLHRRLNRYRVRRHTEHIATERKETSMPFLGLADVAGIPCLDKSFHVARHDIADYGHDPTATDAQERQGKAIIAAEKRNIAKGRDLRGLVQRTGCLLDAD